MPVATIGLFALALVVIGLAFAIQQIVGDGDNNQLSPGDQLATRDAQQRTLTSQAGGGSETQTPGAGETPQTPGTGETPGEATPTPTEGNGGGSTYTVEAGDFCGSIADDNGITLQQLLDANDMTEDDCLNLQPGQVLVIP